MGQTMGRLHNAMPGGGGTNVPDPGQAWGNMDQSQQGAQVIGGLKKGLGQGLQNYFQQNAALRQQPGFYPFSQPQQRGPNNLNFYGEGQ